MRVTVSKEQDVKLCKASGKEFTDEKVGGHIGNSVDLGDASTSLPEMIC